MEFSDYIVFADESGDHGMEKIDPSFPVFALVFCVFEKVAYSFEVEPAVRSLKFKWFGHDSVVLHERELRKQEPPFDFLRAGPAVRDAFMADVSALMTAAPMRVYASVIDKVAHAARYPDPWNPYRIAMQFCMERLCLHLRAIGQAGRRVHVLFESRGAKEDAQLESEFRRVTANEARWGWRSIDFSGFGFEPIFTAKAANMAGHQISDLIARPLALKGLRPDQENRAAAAIWPKVGELKRFP